MILDYYEGKLDGNSWEELCHSCYRIRYQGQHYTEIPASYGGDAGIEGFTQTGIVNQCYCHERGYSDNELYENQRDKMTRDINKLISNGYKKRLKSLGVPVIKEWHFVIPYYKDSRIIQHAETKRKEVLELKSKSPDQFDYIDSSFIIVIKQAEDFKFEITRTLRESLTDMKLNVTIRKVKVPDWDKCDSAKVKNIERKVKAVMGELDDNDEDFNLLINTYIDAYIKGMEIFRILRVSYAEIYEDVYNLEQSYKKQVSIKTRMNTDKNMNIILFNEILDDFEDKLRRTCKYFATDSIIELKIDIISMWLADCSMQFRK